MSREDQHFRLRLPADLREKVEAAAAESRRSLTAEILARLEQTFETKPVTPWLEDRESRAMPLVAADIARIIEETSRTAARLTVEQMQQQYGSGSEDKDAIIERIQRAVHAIEGRIVASGSADAKAAAARIHKNSAKERIVLLDTNVLLDMANRIDAVLEQPPNLLNANPTTPSTPTPKRPSRAR